VGNSTYGYSKVKYILTLYITVQPNTVKTVHTNTIRTEHTFTVKTVNTVTVNKDTLNNSTQRRNKK